MYEKPTLKNGIILVRFNTGMSFSLRGFISK